MLEVRARGGAKHEGISLARCFSSLCSFECCFKLGSHLLRVLPRVTQIHLPSAVAALTDSSDDATHSRLFHDINDDQVLINDLICCEIPSGYTSVYNRGLPPLSSTCRRVKAPVSLDRIISVYKGDAFVKCPFELELLIIKFFLLEIKRTQ